MTARTGMASAIQELRELTHTGASDVTLNGVMYWSDDHLQDELDAWRMTWERIPLRPTPAVIDGATVYTAYPLPGWLGPVFETDATDSGWAVRDSQGAELTGYTVNYAARMLTFDADTGGDTVYLSCRTYAIHRAAAAVWRKKAAFVHLNVDWYSDNHNMKASQEYTHCLEMAVHHAMLAGPQRVQLLRGDAISGEGRSWWD